MQVWSFCIADRQDAPDRGHGFVRAASVDDALGLIAHPDANLYPCPDDAWPEHATGPIVFLRPVHDD